MPHRNCFMRGGVYSLCHVAFTEALIQLLNHSPGRERTAGHAEICIAQIRGVISGG